jgi:hypothetical protein
MFRRDIAKQVGFYKSSEAEDYDLWSRMSTKTRIGCICETLQQRRVWEGQLNLLVPQETIDCGYIITKNNIKRFTKSDIKISEIKSLRLLTKGKFSTLNDNSIEKLEKIIFEIFTKFIEQNDLNSYEKRLISLDTSKKLYKLIKIQKKHNKKTAYYRFLTLHSISKYFVYYIVLQKIIGRNRLQRLYKNTFRQVISN